MKLWLVQLAIVVFSVTEIQGAGLAAPVDVFTAGIDGYSSFRVPAVATAPDGTLLAFCEGRHQSAADHGRIDVVLRRSRDAGCSWSLLQVVWADGTNTCGNPTVVVDRATGVVWLWMTWNRGTDTEGEILSGRSGDTRRVFVTRSLDQGMHWSQPSEITSPVKPPDWRWYATGPGNGIQLTGSDHAGRLVVPANHSIWRSEHAVYRSHVILSDDHGAHWRVGGIEEEQTNESAVVELSDGRLLQNMRSYHGKNRRAVAFSRDGGDSWSPVSLDKALLEPVCQASLIRAGIFGLNQSPVLIFSNPASLRRERLTLRISRDDGATWPETWLLNAGPAAYSCLVELSDSRIGCLFENGGTSPYERISWVTLPDGWWK